MNVGSMFSGDGLLDFGLELAGFDHEWFCEREADRREILRMRWPGVPVYDDVRTIGADSVVRVDVIAGGFPCKGASTAGKRNGFDHAETVLWREMFRAIRELRPRYALLENVANLLSLKRGGVWGEVLADLASIGYDTTWDCIPAAAVGAPHLRDRVFAIATDARKCGRGADEPEVRRRQSDAGWGGDPAAYSPGIDTGEPINAENSVPGGRAARPLLERGGRIEREWSDYQPAIQRWEAIHGPAPEPLVRRVDDRAASRVERSRLSALGDGVQVQVAEIVGRMILELDEQTNPVRW